MKRLLIGLGCAALFVGCVGNVDDLESLSRGEDSLGFELDPGDVPVTPLPRSLFQLRVHTCDTANAPTTDQVSLIADWRYMDHNSGKDVWRSKRIPLQEAGFTRNGWDYYDLLIDQFAMDSEDVQALTLFK